MADVWRHFRRCAAIRNTYPALQTGEYEALLADDAARVFAFRRYTPKQEIIIVTNDSPEAKEVKVPLPAEDRERGITEFVDVLNDPLVRVNLYNVKSDGKGSKGQKQLQVRFGAQTQRVAADDVLQVRLEPHTTGIFLRTEELN